MSEPYVIARLVELSKQVIDNADDTGCDAVTSKSAIDALRAFIEAVYLYLPMIRVKDLKDQTSMEYPRPFLLCGTCGNRSSANKGDYFAASPDTVFTCCGEPMKLVCIREVIEEVSL